MPNIKAKYLTSHREKMIGLLGRDSAIPIYFKTHFGIHTFGMKFPIDVLILNNQNHIVKLSESLTPNHLFVWLPIYEKVLELPSGYIKGHHLKIGDSVSV